MGFESVLGAATAGGDFGKERYALTYKERAHLSKVKLDLHSEAVYIHTGEATTMKFSTLGPRYIAAMDITYDLLLTVYDVNTSKLFAARLFGFQPKSSQQIGGFLRGFGRRANLEARLIGMQNGESTDTLGGVLAFLKPMKLQIVEADLFGNEVRHIAVDSKIGVPYNILKDNRVYRPGELVSTITIEQFEQGLKKAP
ncbi:MAG: hypothetical protein ACP5UH_02230 [Candidatus Micrarchaeia archaeon]